MLSVITSQAIVRVFPEIEASGVTPAKRDTLMPALFMAVVSPGDEPPPMYFSLHILFTKKAWLLMSAN